MTNATIIKNGNKTVYQVKQRFNDKAYMAQAIDKDTGSLIWQKDYSTFKGAEKFVNKHI